jgi:DNA-binding SARP family transcriptional activator/tetratricopeptide (TPR) repeat protein
VGDEFWFTVLGPVRAWRDSVEVMLGTIQQRATLAVLLLNGNTHVSVDELVDALWGADPPRSAGRVIRTYVYRLRKALQSPVIESVGGGYLVRVTTSTLDLAAFRQARTDADTARRDGDPETAATRLREALALWQGQPLADIQGPYAEAQRENLARLRQAAVESRLAAEVELGAPGEVVAELVGLVAENPLHERFRELLMLALYHRGQQAQALEVYRDAVSVLSTELGIDPGPGLQAVHERILRSDPDLLATPPPTPSPSSVTPAQLPADLPTFAGRRSDLKRIDATLPTTEAKPATVVVTVITGMAGVGKTTLAVHWAHQVAHRFPDGVIHLDLHGFGPADAVVQPGEAVNTVLAAFGVRHEHIPANSAAQAALYRSVLADRRVLLLIDNARDADQVRPLLPGAPGCLVIVTSRDQLTGLIARDGARPVHLDALPEDEAREFLVGRVGEDRLAAEPDAVDEILDRCAGLPLALAIVATRAMTRPTFAIADLAAELRAARGGLDAFSDNDSAMDVRAVFSWSCRGLSPEAGRMFRLLAAQPGPDFTISAAASILALSPARVRTLAAELTQADMIAERSPGRYSYHDLLGAYAAELAGRIDTESERRAALHRLLDHYLHSAHAASTLLYANADPLSLPPAAAHVVVERFTDTAEALHWLTREHLALRAAMTRAGGSAQFDTHTCALAQTLSEFLQRQGRWDDQLTAQSLAVDAARRMGDAAALGRAHRSLAVTYSRTGRHDNAHHHFRLALDLFDRLGDHAGQARVHRAMAASWGSQGRYDLALRHSRQAHGLYLPSDDVPGQAAALNDIGWCQTQLGDHRGALDSCRHALDLFRELGNKDGEASAWDSLGYVHHQLEDLDQAAQCFQHAIDLFRGLGDLHSEATVLVHLGDTQQAAGNARAAWRSWHSAIGIYERLDPGAANRLSHKLEGVRRT